MCGLFGFIGRDGESPIDVIVEDLAIQTESRGPHSWGVAWIGRDGRVHSYKQPGRISKCIDLLLHLVRDSVAFVAHTRWATHGSPTDNQNNHPHPCDGGWLTHNGVVSNHDHLAKMKALHPITDCDSEILAQLIEHATPLDRISRIAESVDLCHPATLAMAGIWRHPYPSVYLVRRGGQPLSVGECKHGLYYASNQKKLPGEVSSLPENEIFEFRVKMKRNRKRSAGRSGVGKNPKSYVKPVAGHETKSKALSAAKDERVSFAKKRKADAAARRLISSSTPWRSSTSCSTNSSTLFESTPVKEAPKSKKKNEANMKMRSAPVSRARVVVDEKEAPQWESYIEKLTGRPAEESIRKSEDEEGRTNVDKTEKWIDY